MPATYENFGVKLLYPENWRVVDEELGDEPKGVSLQTPEGGFWSLHVYEGEQDVNLLVDEVMANIRREYQEVEQEAVSERFGLTETVGFDLNFICLDFVVTAELRCGTVQGRSFVVLCQAEDNEFEKMGPVFKAITHGWLANPSESGMA